MLEKTRPKVKPYVDRVAKLFIKVPPNVLSALGPVVAFIYFILMVNGWYWVALVALAGMVLDSLDGAVARMTHKESAFGAFWDATLDRVADMLLIAAWGVAGLIAWEWVVLAMGLNVLISYTRSKAGEVSKGEVRLAVGIIERGERLLFIAGMTLVGALGWWAGVQLILLVLIGLSFITLMQRVRVARRKLK